MSELPTEHFEHVEHAEHAAHFGDSFIVKVSMTVAILAVLASGVSSLETLETSGLTVKKNEAVLLQNKATDNWNFFQAKSMKKSLYEIAAANGGPKSDDYLKESQRYKNEQNEIEERARRLETASEDAMRESDIHEHRHHILTIAATMLHISIAVATIAIITRGQRWPWIASMVLGAAGVCAAILAYVPLFGAGH